MNDALRVRRLQRVGELQPEIHDFPDPQGWAFRPARRVQALLQRLAFEQFHGDERNPPPWACLR